MAITVQGPVALIVDFRNSQALHALVLLLTWHVCGSDATTRHNEAITFVLQCHMHALARMMPSMAL